MNTDAKSFIEIWIEENIVPEGYAAPGDMLRAKLLAELCETEANREGIPSEELKEAVRDMIGNGDDLVDLMASAMVAATNAEISRLAKNDN